MERDIQDMPETRRKELLKYMSEFVPLGIKKDIFQMKI